MNLDNFSQNSDYGKQYNLFENEKSDSVFIRSSSKQLDQFMSGGLHKGMVTQIYGEAGTGKSQIAMLYVLGAISRSMSVCFLSTDKEISWQRFTTLAYSFMNEAEFEEKEQFLMYKKSSDFSQGMQFIEQALKKIKEKQRGGLLIIDSVHTFIMSCLQHNNSQNDQIMKSKYQSQIVNRIRWLSKMSGVGVILINHAADAMDRKRNSGLVVKAKNLIASLGPSWDLNMDESIMVSKKKEIRDLIVIHSPKCAVGRSRKFRIENEGFVWISEEGIEQN